MTTDEIQRKLSTWLVAEKALIAIIDELRKTHNRNELLSLTEQAKIQSQLRVSAQNAYFETVQSWIRGV